MDMDIRSDDDKSFYYYMRNKSFTTSAYLFKTRRVGETGRGSYRNPTMGTAIQSADS